MMRGMAWLAAGAVLLSGAATAEPDGPVGEPLQVLTEPYLLGSWTQLYQVYPARLIARGGQVREMPRSPRPLGDVVYQYEGESHSLDTYFGRNGVTSLLVLVDGQIAYETYRMGTSENTLFVSWSMAKSVTSTLLGLLLTDGRIGSLDDLAVKYVPELADSGYRQATLRDLLQMASGVRFVEDYYNQNSREGRAWVDGAVERRLPYNETILWFDEQLHPPGTRFQYASIETQVIGWVVRRVAGKPLAELFSERIWSGLGAEHDANWVLDRPGGMEIASCCISATLRDYGRFGQLFLDRGHVGDRVLVSPDWVDLATRPDPERGFLHPGKIEGENGLGYQHFWWLWPQDGAYSALGHGGQWMYVNPRRRVVIVQTAVWHEGLEGKGYPETQAVFNAIVAALSAR